MAALHIAQNAWVCKIAYCRVCLNAFAQNTGRGRKRTVCSSCKPQWKPSHACNGCGVALPPGGRRHSFCSAQCRVESKKTILGCAECGSPIGRYRKRWCEGCVRERKRHPQKPKTRARLTAQHTCLQCSKPFHPLKGKVGKFCSLACTFEHQSNRFLVERERRQQHLLLTKPGPHSRVYPHTCAECDKEFWSTSGVSTYCSSDCSKQKERRAALKRNSARKEVKPRACRECGTTFVAPYGDHRRTFCSDDCSRTSGHRIARATRRARVKTTAIEQVDPLKVFERDGWRCQLCHKTTPKRLRGKMVDLAPELDHIIPLSRGGEHSYRNTQCACRKCNGAKGNQILGQLRLCG